MEWEFGFVEEREKPYDIGRRSFYFARDILKFVKETRHESVFRSLFDQLVRSATSIGANIIEGRAGSSKRDWKKSMIIALKSANEVKYWLCLIREVVEVDMEKVKYLLEEANEISKILGSIIIKANLKP